jgi:cob(I)alamin adenosyltransferase
MSIATKTGDAGTTALMYGRRVSKSNPRVEAYGSIDELNATLGLVRSTVDDGFIREPIFSIQEELVILMGELAVVEEDRERYVRDGHKFVTHDMVERLTTLINDLEKNHKLNFKHWATPGTTLGSAALEVARTVCRRAERRVIELGEMEPATNAEIIRYLNRLSDLCWLYARFIETKAQPH